LQTASQLLEHSHFCGLERGKQAKEVMKRTDDEQGQQGEGKGFIMKSKESHLGPVKSSSKSKGRGSKEEDTIMN